MMTMLEMRDALLEEVTQLTVRGLRRSGYLVHYDPETDDYVISDHWTWRRRVLWALTHRNR